MLIVLFNCAVMAQLKFTAKATPATIGKNETVELILMVENAANVEQINPPPFNNFIIVSGPNQESGMENINGNVRQYTGITYILQPRGKGDFTLAASTAKADGKFLKGNPVNIKVTNSSSVRTAPSSPFSGILPFDEPEPEPQFNDFILKKGERLYDKINKNIFIKTVADKTTCYVGEPVIVTYKLYTRLKSESNIVKNPSLNGFSVIDLVLPGNISYTVEKLNGRAYNVYILRKAQLYPLQAGDAELESAEVENNIHFIKEEYLQSRPDDLFGGFSPAAIPAAAMLNEKVSLQSTPVIINVKPLPDAGKPASFTGAVGKFSIEAAVEKNNFTTADAGKLKITINGQGNLTLINAPDIAWPQDTEGYDPAVKDELNKLTVPVSGSKIIEYPFTVAKAGTYILPPVEFSYFDIAAKKYKVVTTTAITVTVAKGTDKKNESPVFTVNKSSREKFFDTIFTERRLIVLPIAILIITGLLWWLKKDKRKQAVDTDKQIAAAENAIEKNEYENIRHHNLVNPLGNTAIKLAAHDAHCFYQTINKELRFFLSVKLQLQAETMNKKNIADALDKTGIAFNKSLGIQQLLDDIEWQLYTPFADESNMQEIYERAEMLVHAFDKNAVQDSVNL